MTSSDTPVDPAAQDPEAVTEGTEGTEGKDAVDAIARQWNAVRPDLDTVPMTAYGRIYRISRAMGDRVEKEYREYGINRGEFDVLATLRRSGDPYTLSPSRLSATLMLTTGGMTGRLDRLERAGLLTRNPDPHDRRGLRITLTERGLGLVDEAVTAGVRVQSAVLGSALTPAEADELNALLRKVLSAHE